MFSRFDISRTTFGVLTALALGVAAPANATGDGAARSPARSAQAEDRGDVAEAAEPPGGSVPGAVVWVALGLGIALMIVVIGLSNAETVSE